MYGTVGGIGRGLSNELGGIITGIMYAHLRKKKFLILDDFYKSYNVESPCPISDIIDLDDLNLKLSDLNLYIVDKNNINIKILNVKYGTGNRYIDITDTILKIH